MREYTERRTPQRTGFIDSTNRTSENGRTSTDCEMNVGEFYEPLGNSFE
jgi:hypothetical protein